MRLSATFVGIDLDHFGRHHADERDDEREAPDSGTEPRPEAAETAIAVRSYVKM